MIRILCKGNPEVFFSKSLDVVLPNESKEKFTT